MEKTKIIVFFYSMLLVLTGCQENNKKTLITVNMSQDFPKRELILQDFMETEYIPLETNDEFVTQGDVMAIGEKYILVKNWYNDGDIFFFDRNTGKGVRKINRKGQGAEEYTFINNIILDEINDELFINNSSAKKIHVYDLYGKYKRSFNHIQNCEYLNILDYDKNNLICYDMSIYYEEGKKRSKQYYHMIISKKDGSITKKIPIPFEKVKSPFIQEGDQIAVASVRAITPYEDNWILAETSSDTIYNYIQSENKLTPFIIKHSPVNQEVFLTIGAITDHYCFMQMIKKKFDFKKRKGFPMTNLLYDIKDNKIFEITVLNNDIKDSKVDFISHPLNNKITAFQILTTNQIIEAYEKNKLKGKIRDIAKDLEEDSNPIILLMKKK